LIQQPWQPNGDLDEIDKDGTVHRNGNLLDALLPMLEPRSAAAYQDAFVQAPVGAIAPLGRFRLSSTSKVQTHKSPLMRRA
jgi:hypothetical protein